MILTNNVVRHQISMYGFMCRIKSQVYGFM